MLWYAPAPTNAGRERLTLDFGLRAADAHFRELVVPGLGRVWFARQLSWPIAALALAREHPGLGGSATTLCHALEALGAKLSFEAGSSPERILGVRAFRRESSDARAWTFEDLRSHRHYVRNTHRGAAVAALRGLRLASGPRFDRLELTEEGWRLAQAFLGQRVLRGNQQLGHWLVDWVAGSVEVPASHATLLSAVGVEVPPDTGAGTPGEAVLIRRRLFELVSDPAGTRRVTIRDAVGGSERPRPMLEVVERVAARDAVHHRDLVAALAFGALLDRARDTVFRLKDVVAQHGPRGVAPVDASKACASHLEALRVAADNLAAALSAAASEPTAQRFVSRLREVDDPRRLEDLVGRAEDAFTLADGRIQRGPRFDRLQGTGSQEFEAPAPDERNDASFGTGPLRTARSFRIMNVHSLHRDVRVRPT